MATNPNDEIPAAARRFARAMDDSSRFVARGITSIAFNSLALGIGALTLSVVGATSALKSITTEATQTARALGSMRANNGIGYAQGYGLMSRASLFGMNAQQTAAMYNRPGMNPMAAGLVGRATGFGSPYDPNYLVTASARYQGMASRGWMGRQMANALTPEELRPTLNLGPERIASQLAFGKKVDAGLGIDAEAIRRFNEEIPLAVDRIKYLGTAIRTKLAVDLIPVIERSLGVATEYLIANVDKIGATITTVSTFLVETLPVAVLRFGAHMAHASAGVLEVFSVFTGGVAGNVPHILGAFDGITNSIRLFIGNLVGLGSMIVQLAGSVWQGIQNTGLPKLAQTGGQLITGLQSNTTENQTTNTIIGGGALALAARGGLALLARGGAAAGAAGAAGAGAGAGGIGGFLSTLNPVMWATAAGGALGAGGYALLRKTGIPNAINRVTGFGGQEDSVFGSIRNAAGRVGDLGAGALKLATYGALGRDAFVKDDNGQISFAYDKAMYMQRFQQDKAVRDGKKIPGSFGDPSSALSYVPGRSPMDAFVTGRDSVFNSWAPSASASNPAIVGNLERLFGGTSGATGAGAEKLHSLGDSLSGLADSHTSEIKKLREQMGRDLGRIERRLAEEVDQSRSINRNTRDLIPRTAAYIADDATRQLMHT